MLDRNKETGSVGEPVYLDVVTALNQAGRGDIRVVGGRYGLSSKDTTPGQIIAVYDNLKQETPKNNFTIGINDDVTHTSLDYKEIELAHPGQISCKLWGLGGDGTVGANKNAISTIGFVADKYAQAYFSYDSMKSGGLTQSHLRFGDEPIRSTYLVSSADFVACHAPTYVKKYDTDRGSEGRRHLPAELPVDGGGAGGAPARQDEARSGAEARAASTSSTLRSWRRRSAWASAPTTSCRARSSP